MLVGRKELYLTATRPHLAGPAQLLTDAIILPDDGSVSRSLDGCRELDAFVGGPIQYVVVATVELRGLRRKGETVWHGDAYELLAVSVPEVETDDEDEPAEPDYDPVLDSLFADLNEDLE